MRSLHYRLRIVLILVCTLPCQVLHARLVRSFDIEQLAKEAEELVVGEVVSVVVTQRLKPEDTRWGAPLLRMTATIRVLRAVPSTDPELAAGKQFTLTFLNLDPDDPAMLINGPEFPELSKGMVRVFPLHYSKDKQWELLDEEDFNQLMPAVADLEKPGTIDPKTVAPLIEQLGSDNFETREKAFSELLAKGRGIVSIVEAALATATDPEVRSRLARLLEKLEGSAVDFLRSEYANALARGDARTRFKVAHWSGLNPEDALAVDAQLLRALEKDTPAWLQILAALYAENYSENLTFSDWAASAEGTDGRRTLAHQIWPRIPHEKLDEQIITAAFVPGVPHGGTLQLLRRNKLLSNPLTMKLLRAALTDGNADAVAVAYHCLNEPQPPEWLPAATAGAAVKLLQAQTAPEYDHFYAACHCILYYGGPQERRALFDAFVHAQKHDPKRFRDIWNTIYFVENTAVLPFCAVMLNDTAPHKPTQWRNCDVAVITVQKVLHQQFGIDEKQTFNQRNAAVEKAKAWLAAHKDD